MAVSAERIAVAWLKADTAVATLTGGKVATNLTDTAVKQGWPWVIVKEIGGGDTAVDPVDRPYLQMSCYGDDDDQADNLALAVIDAVKQLRRQPYSSGGESGTLIGGQLVAKRNVSEPTTEWGRFDVDGILAVREDR